MPHNDDIMSSYVLKINTERCIKEIIQKLSQRNISFKVTSDNIIQISQWDRINQQHRGICNFIVRCAKHNNIISHIIPNDEYTAVKIHFTQS